MIFGLGHDVPYAIPLLLGPEWTAVTGVSQALLVAVGIQFVVSPLSGVILLNRHGSWGFFWQLAFALVMAALLAVSWLLDVSLDAFTMAMSGGFFVMYTLYGVVIFLSCRVADNARTPHTHRRGWLKTSAHITLTSATHESRLEKEALRLIEDGVVARVIVYARHGEGLRPGRRDPA